MCPSRAVRGVGRVLGTRPPAGDRGTQKCVVRANIAPHVERLAWARNPHSLCTLMACSVGGVLMTALMFVGEPIARGHHPRPKPSRGPRPPALRARAAASGNRPAWHRSGNRPSVGRVQKRVRKRRRVAGTNALARSCQECRRPPPSQKKNTDVKTNLSGRSFFKNILVEHPSFPVPCGKRTVPSQCTCTHRLFPNLEKHGQHTKISTIFLISPREMTSLARLDTTP